LNFDALKNVKAYTVDWHPDFGLAAGDYRGGCILLHENPIDRARPVTAIDVVTTKQGDVPLAFVHAVTWTSSGRLLASVSKLQRHAPKGQGCVLEIDLQTRTAWRIDDLFRDPSIETFPTFAVRLQNGCTAIAYSGIGALAVVDARGSVETLVADASSRAFFRDEPCRDARWIDAALNDPHGIAEFDGGICVADTGNDAVVHVSGNGLRWLVVDDASRASWSAQVPQHPIFEKPLSLTRRSRGLRIGLLGAQVAFLDAADGDGKMSLERRSLAGKRRLLFGLLPVPGAVEHPQVFDSHDLPGYILASDAKRGIFLFPQAYSGP
jgi:hypothetical protein